MAINYGAYGAGQNQPVVVDQGIDPGQAFQQGVDNANAIYDRELKLQRDEERQRMAQEAHDRQMRAADTLETMRQAEITASQKEVEQAQLNFENDLRDYIEGGGTDPALANSEAYKEAVKHTSDIIAGTYEGEIPGIYENGKLLVSEDRLSEVVDSDKEFYNGMGANREWASEFLKTPDLDIASMGDKYKVLQAIQNSGYKKGKYNSNTGKSDMIITLPGGKEVTIPNGDLKGYFADAQTKYGPNQVIEGVAATNPVIKALYQGKTVTPAQVQSALPALINQFDTQQKIDSFARSVGIDKDPTPNTPWTAEDAANVALGNIQGVFSQSIVAPKPKGFSASDIDRGQRFFNYTQTKNLEHLVDGTTFSGSGKDEDTGKEYLVLAKNGRKFYLSDDPELRQQQIQNNMNVDQSLFDYVTPKPTNTTTSSNANVDTNALPDDPTSIDFSKPGNTDTNSNVSISNEGNITPPSNEEFVSPRHKNLNSQYKAAEKAYYALQRRMEKVCKTDGLESASCKSATKFVDNKKAEMDKKLAQIEQEKASAPANDKAKQEQLIDDLLS